MIKEEIVAKYNLTGAQWEKFSKWMRGQTCGVRMVDGKPECDFYEYDVSRYFDKYGGEAKNEPVTDFD